MFQLFKRNTEEDSNTQRKNWYADRYQSIVVQRNFFALITLLMLVCVIVSLFTVIKITSSKTIEPFVIQIDEKSGITNVIRPLLKEQFAYDDVIRDYFLWKYVNAREGYNFYTYQYNYFTITRLLSTPLVYTTFKRIVRTIDPESPLRFGTAKDRFVKIKSISPLPQTSGKSGFSAQVRFALIDGPSINAPVKKHQVATIVYDFLDLKLTREERAINPLGFQVLSYRLDADAL